MSAWEKALEFTLAYEGGYANDELDRGGETFRGISRRNWPKWDGWEIVDGVKKSHPTEYRTVLLQDMHLLDVVKEFYRKNFWDEIHGDELPGKFAVSLFDMAVHSGPRVAVRQLQSTLEETLVDGYVGPKTVKACHEAGELGLVDFLAARARFLNNIILESHDQKAWAMNWFKRLFRLANFVLEGDGVEFPLDTAKA